MLGWIVFPIEDETALLALTDLCRQDERFGFDKSSEIFIQGVTPDEMKSIHRSGDRVVGVYSKEYVQQHNVPTKRCDVFSGTRSVAWTNVPSFLAGASILIEATSETLIARRGELYMRAKDIVKREGSGDSFYDRNNWAY